MDGGRVGSEVGNEKVTMRAILSLLVFCFSLGTAASYADKEAELWTALASECKEMDEVISKLQPNTGLDLRALLSDLVGIQKILKEMVSAGILIEKSLSLKPMKEMSEEGRAELKKLVAKVGEERGDTVSRELFDMGMRHRAGNPDGVIDTSQITVRLVEKDMSALETLVKDFALGAKDSD